MKNRTFLLLTCTLLLCACANNPPPVPEFIAHVDTGFSVDRLERIDNYVEQALAEQRVAGAVAMVYRNGLLAYSNAWGMADRESNSPMVEDTIFRIASMTKPITSVAVMMLYEQGLFGLDDPISRYLPAFDRQMQVVQPNDDGYELVDATRPITIRNLLTHTSGLSYRFLDVAPLAELYKEAGITDGLGGDLTLPEFVDRLAAMPLAHQPGEGWTYGLNADVLGYFVEVVSGQPFAEFARERIFEPLGMRDTSFTLTDDKRDRLAAVYRRNADGRLQRTADLIDEGPVYVRVDYPAGEGPTLASGGGGLLSTAGDYGRFAQMILNGGELDGQRLLSRKTVELMTSDQVGRLELAAFNGTGFGLGFAVEHGPSASGQLGSPGVLGWSGFFNTEFWIDPEEELIGILMIQHYPYGTALLARYRTLVYQALDD
jgi:CubicO group peptidase (beta-lactamase class C family)